MPLPLVSFARASPPDSSLVRPFLLLVALIVFVPDRSVQIVALGEALAWPLVVLAIAVAFRTVDPLVGAKRRRSHQGGIHSRVRHTGVGAGPRSRAGLEHSGSRQPRCPAAHPRLYLRQREHGTFSRGSKRVQEGDFAVVDLARGEEWVTTRLLIFTVCPGAPASAALLRLLGSERAGTPAVAWRHHTRERPRRTGWPLPVAGDRPRERRGAAFRPATSRPRFRP